VTLTCLTITANSCLTILLCLRLQVALDNLDCTSFSEILSTSPKVAMPHQRVTNDSLEDIVTHYQVLDLPWNFGVDSDLSAQHLKAAYRRALFQHHPDKIGAQSDLKHGLETAQKPSKKATYTIDQITEAYATLSIPKFRSEYDRVLKLRARPTKDIGQVDDQTFRSGLEIVDLDDLNYDEMGEVWLKSCRCGDERGFQIREVDLEEAADLGELHAGCRGCSLWLKVLFGVIEEKAEDHATDSR
jgi:diphthamide biosynthesis protein 4